MEYNREERAICSHLFRLLHEKLAENPLESGLAKFLQILFRNSPDIKGIEYSVSRLNFENIGIYPEVALIRDAYFARSPNVHPFMDQLVEIIQKQEGISKCRKYSELRPEVLCDPLKTHPVQIRRKAEKYGSPLEKSEDKVYGALQGMFNAKPDLVITIDQLLLTFEVKFTQKFQSAQIKRTEKIVKVWSSELLYGDLGFTSPPNFRILKLGASAMNVDISWKDIYEIGKKFYSEKDRTLLAFKSVVNILKEQKLLIESS